MRKSRKAISYFYFSVLLSKDLINKSNFQEISHNKMYFLRSCSILASKQDGEIDVDIDSLWEIMFIPHIMLS